MSLADPRQIAALRKRIESLRASKRAELRRQIEASGIRWRDVCPTSDNELELDDRPAPSTRDLTPSEKQIWALHQLHPNLTAYHIAFAWQFRGKLDLLALNASLDKIIERHTSLRANFHIDDEGKPLRIVRPNQPITLATEIVSHDEYEQRKRSLVDTPFELASEPLYRFRVYRIKGEPEETHFLAIVLHHLIADGWSRGILLRDIATCYEDGGMPESAPTGERMAKLNQAVFESDEAWRQSDTCRDGLEYWKRHLHSQQPLELPTDYRASATAAFSSRTLTYSINKTVGDGIQRIAQQNKGTLFTALL
ncbi:MAG: condensation domain-containing protein, partial [Planctomycetota bacterium]